MPGLLEQRMTPQPGITTPGAQPTAPQTGQMPPQEKAPGFDQKELDIFIANGMKLIHTEKISDRIISMVVDAKNPVQALANATLNIVGRLEQSSAAAGKKLSLTTLAYGANVLMGEIISSAEAAGMKKMDEKTRYYAFSLAVGKYLDDAIKTGKMTKEELMQLSQEAEASPAGQKIQQAAMKMGQPVPPEAQPPEAVPPEPLIGRT